jgi:hypothetical protein
MSSTQLRAAVPIAAALLALGVLQLSAPAYLLHQGFPLDDAWIHAVYAREFGRSATLAYNPGVPATGETSPLWAVVIAPAFRAATTPDMAAALVKAIGFSLHLAAAVVLTIALAAILPGREWWAGLAGTLVAAHPALVAGAVSGMEVPLAAALTALAVFFTTRSSALALALLTALAFAGRPETPVIIGAFAFLFWIGVSFRRAWLLSAAAAGGGVASAALLGIRNHAATGWYLPATFHAKTARSFSVDAIVIGFRDLMAHLPPVESALAIAALTAVSIVLVRRAQTTAGRAGAALYLSGTIFCGVSFALIPPVDPGVFYYERYVLPGLFVMLAALPLIVSEVAGTLSERRVVVSVAAALLIGPLLAAAPARYRRLANDTRNIDDVQVAFGKSLAGRNRAETLWVVDAGASRFFGAPFVVDMIGLNSPAVLRADAQQFLDAHPPRYIDVFPSWSSIEGAGETEMPHRAFKTSTDYTVANNRAMRQHVLVECEPPSLGGVYLIRGRRFPFQCAS